MCWSAWAWKPRKYMLLSAHREENIDTEQNFIDLFTSINRLAETYDMPILYSAATPAAKSGWMLVGFKLDERVQAARAVWASTITTTCR